MTLCNMSIEAGAVAALIAPDEVTFSYLAGRRFAPADVRWPAAVSQWRTLVSDPGAAFDATIDVDISALAPLVTWGTRPDMVVPITAAVPDPKQAANAIERQTMERALDLHGARTGHADRCGDDRSRVHRFVHQRADRGSARRGARGSRPSRQPRVQALVVPGSQRVKAAAEREGLDLVFKDAGFEWREPGCSMCLGMNRRRVAAGRAFRLDEQSQLRRPPGPRWTHASGEPGDGRRGCDPRALCRRARLGLPLMKPFRRHHGRVAPLLRRDVDTDQIVPKQFLKRLERTGFGQFLFHDWRTRSDGQLEASFVLNQPRYAEASILVAGANFGCGSSREHAAWALADFGFAVIIAPSFADIFRANAVANGLVPLALGEQTVARIGERAEMHDGYALTVDLEACRITDDLDLDESFLFDAGARERLLKGLDDIGLILTYEADIARYEGRRAG